MAFMCRDAHIDPQLFALFIEEQIYQQYADRYLDPVQIDAVDRESLLAKAGLVS